MIDNYKSLAKTSGLDACIDMHLSNDDGFFFNESKCAQSALKNFVSDSGFLDPEFISLGENCSSAWYIKQAGLKKASYPFDWVFSSPRIVLDCINDRFGKYLNKSMIEPSADNQSAGHKCYHSRFFSHRNPLKSEDDYNYYKRCCLRFMQQLEEQRNTFYVITLINEPAKRSGWTNGFVYDFEVPLRQDCQTIRELKESIQRINMNSRFIVVDHYTNSKRSVNISQADEDMIFLSFYAAGRSTGVCYSDQMDDYGFKLIMSGLCGIPPSRQLIGST